MNIKCRISGLRPDAVLLVATIRALKMHGLEGVRVRAGKPLPPEIAEENVEAVERGCANLVKHIENVNLFGVPCVVLVNRFTDDTDAEVEAVRRAAEPAGAYHFETSRMWAQGSSGGMRLAVAMAAACEEPSDFRFLYPDDATIKEKIKTIATKVYGADRVKYTSSASRKIRRFTSLGYDKLPICLAKTHLSISHDPLLKGRPTGFTLPIRDVRPSLGAGFLYPLCGDMRTIPGLPSHPAGERLDLDEDGNVVGLF
jgi:formate--tetrahydrofolate ligase